MTLHFWFSNGEDLRILLANDAFASHRSTWFTCIRAVN